MDFPAIEPLVMLSIGQPIGRNGNTGYITNKGSESKRRVRPWDGPLARVELGASVGPFSLTVEHQSAPLEAKDTGLNAVWFRVDLVKLNRLNKLYRASW